MSAYSKHCTRSFADEVFGAWYKTSFCAFFQIHFYPVLLTSISGAFLTSASHTVYWAFQLGAVRLVASIYWTISDFLWLIRCIFRYIITVYRLVCRIDLIG